MLSSYSHLGPRRVEAHRARGEEREERVGQEERVFGDKLLGSHMEGEGAGRVEGDSQAPVGEQVDRAAGGSRDGWVRPSFVGKCGFGVGHVGQGGAESAGDWEPSPGGQAGVGGMRGLAGYW